MEANLPTYKIEIVDTDTTELLVSLVNDPAIEENFIYFSSDAKQYHFDVEKQIVTGPVFIPNKKIYRSDANGEYYVFMDAEGIAQYVKLFIKSGGNKININHSNTLVSADIIESYFAKAQNEFGVPEGSWILSVKIESSDIWEDIKSGTYKGFSLEGKFRQELVKFNINQKQNKNMKKEEILESFKTLLFADAPIETPAPIEAPTPVDTYSKEEIDAKIAELIALIDSIEISQGEAMAAQESKFAASLKTIDTKVEEFGKLPVDEIKSPYPKFN